MKVDKNIFGVELLKSLITENVLNCMGNNHT